MDLSRDPFMSGGPAPRVLPGPHPLSQAHYPSSFERSDGSSRVSFTPTTSSVDTRRLTSPADLAPSPTLTPSPPLSESGSDGNGDEEGSLSSDEGGVARTSTPSSSHQGSGDSFVASNGKVKKRTKKRPPPQTYTDTETETEPESYSPPPSSSSPLPSSSTPPTSFSNYDALQQQRRVGSQPSSQRVSNVSHASREEPLRNLVRFHDGGVTSNNASRTSFEEGSVSSTSSGIENTELGGRWLREQGEILAKKTGPVGSGAGSGSRGGGSRRGGGSDRSATSEREEEANGQMPEGGLELERDANGRCVAVVLFDKCDAKLTFLLRHLL